MARMMFDNLNAIVANTITDSIKMVDIDELHESSDNFFVVERVEEFAETILGQGGVKDNLIVRPLETGGYEIISGHRRRAAVQFLLDKGENVSRYLPCLVQNYNDEDTKMLDIVLMNISARQISDAEMWKSYEIVDQILRRKKNAGEKFGRVREKLAECLGVSPAQVGKMQNVEKNAIDSVKEAVENGDMSISTANEIAKLDEEEQELLMQQSDVSEIKHKDVKKKNKNKPDSHKTKEKGDFISEEKTSENFDKTEVDICSNFSESMEELRTTERDVISTDAASDKLTEYIFKNYYALQSVLVSAISMAASDEEKKCSKSY